MGSSMSGMTSTFSSSTRVTLWFTTWTTTTPATYTLTLVLLFSLGMLNRFLGAYRSQLEQKWQKQRGAAAHTLANKAFSFSIALDDARQSRSRASSTRLPHRREENEPLSPRTAHDDDQEKGLTSVMMISKPGFWVANAPWSYKRDGMSACVEFLRALIGYILHG
ncbi:hypothetical protein ACEQ8H_005872 [Pleosporales sp. CAS-2024a]